MKKKLQLMNDTFRLDPERWGTLLISDGVQLMGAAFVEKVVIRARTYDDFTPANDPHGEHDFASFVIEGTTCFFKVDYFAWNLQDRSTDPGDPSITKRVMTVALMDEY